MSVGRPRKKSSLRTLALVSVALVPFQTFADTVTVHSHDGTLALKGELVAFEENTYSLRTALGPLNLSSARVSCLGQACPSFKVDNVDIKVSGSDAFASGVMPLLISGYADYIEAKLSATVLTARGDFLATVASDTKQGPVQSKFLITPSSSGEAIKELQSGAVDIALTSKSGQIDGLPGTTERHLVGSDNLVVITHPDNPVSTLAMWQLKKVYSGEIDNWSQLGGDDAPITVISQQSGSETRNLFEDHLFAMDRNANASLTVNATDHNSVAARVVADPHAIGYVSRAFTRGSKPLNLVDECGFKQQPDMFSAKAGETLFQRNFYMYTSAEKDVPAQSELIAFATSRHADAAIASAGFFDFSIESKVQTLDSPRAQKLREPSSDPFEGVAKRDMLSQMVHYQRLSTTFHFEIGTSKLDERSGPDMARLAEYLDELPYGTTVMFVGFTDDLMPFATGRALSIQHAAQTMSNFTENAGSDLTKLGFVSTGFGAVAPTACNTTQKGRAVNRRVEVWVSRATS